MLRTPPRGSQAKAVGLALGSDGFLLFPEQRVGKTWISLAVVDARKPRKLLIVCRKIGVKVWQDEIIKHLEIDWDLDYRIITHESLNKYGAKEIRKWLKKDYDPQVAMIIVDECHRIKKRGSRASRTIRQIAKHYSRYRIGLSGTPADGEKFENIWPQMDLVDPSVYGTFEEFGYEYLVLGGFKGLKVVGYRNEEKFKRLLHEHSYRVTLQQERKKKYKVRTRVREFELDPKTREIYDQLEAGLDVEVHRKKVQLKELMHSAMKCHQLCGGYLIRGEDNEGEKLKHKEVIPVHDGKLQLLGKIILTHSAEKLVIIARYRHELAAIRKLCRGQGRTYKTVCGGKPYDGQFDKDIVIVQIQSGISIDLSASSIAIFYSADYSFINNSQARSRVLSFDQPMVTYYYLLARNTVDVEVYDAFRTKRKLSDVLLEKRRNA